MSKVPLKDHFDAVNAERRRTTIVAFLGLIAVGWAVIQGMEKATAVALTAANEKGVHHNGLIDRMREMSQQFVTWRMVLLLITLAITLATLAAGFLR